MSGIEFEENGIYQTKTKLDGESINSKPGAMIQFLLKIGVKDINTANYILIGVAVVLFGIIIFIYSSTSKNAGVPKLTPEQQVEQIRFITGTSA